MERQSEVVEEEGEGAEVVEDYLEAVEAESLLVTTAAYLSIVSQHPTWYLSLCSISSRSAAWYRPVVR